MSVTTKIDLSVHGVIVCVLSPKSVYKAYPTSCMSSVVVSVKRSCYWYWKKALNAFDYEWYSYASFRFVVSMINSKLLPTQFTIKLLPLSFVSLLRVTIPSSFAPCGTSPSSKQQLRGSSWRGLRDAALFMRWLEGESLDTIWHLSRDIGLSDFIKLSVMGNLSSVCSTFLPGTQSKFW